MELLVLLFVGLAGLGLVAAVRRRKRRGGVHRRDPEHAPQLSRQGMLLVDIPAPEVSVSDTEHPAADAGTVLEQVRDLVRADRGSRITVTANDAGGHDCDSGSGRGRVRTAVTDDQVHVIAFDERDLV